MCMSQKVLTPLAHFMGNPTGIEPLGGKAPPNYICCKILGMRGIGPYSARCDPVTFSGAFNKPHDPHKMEALNFETQSAEKLGFYSKIRTIFPKVVCSSGRFGSVSPRKPSSPFAGKTQESRGLQQGFRVHLLPPL